MSVEAGGVVQLVGASVANAGDATTSASRAIALERSPGRGVKFMGALSGTMRRFGGEANLSGTGAPCRCLSHRIAPTRAIQEIQPWARRTIMDINGIHEHARRLVNAHGDKAELEAAQKAAEYERQGEKRQAVDWRRIQAAIKELRGPHAS
jgi:hypothetical protein